MEILYGVRAFVKTKLGLCNSKGCYKKAIVEIKIGCINTKRCLCKKHLEVYEQFFKEENNKKEKKL